MDSYITVRDIAEYQFEDRRSKFIGIAAPVSSESEAIEIISSVKRRFPDARHWVYAYVLRENSIMRFSDDREPQGTAGMPVLDVIRKNGCTDVCIVVTRYFGGILLGTGGLVHAYTEAALGALKNAKVIKYDVYSEVKVTVSYSDFQRIGNALSSFEFQTKDTEYSDQVTLFGSVLSEKCDDFCGVLIEICSGRCKTEVIEEKYDFR